jgi:hypothetical protein
MRRPALVGLVMLLALAAAAPNAAARDSEAPRGASHRWLPCEDWVMHHWVPYDERRLFALLGYRRAAVLRWLRDDRHHTLAQLARRQGRDPERLADALVAPSASRATPEHHAELRRRALRTLTQGHLAQHLFFHPYHQPAIALRARSLFGVSALSYQRRRLLGRSPAQIAATRGRSRRALARRAMAVFRAAGDEGVTRGWTPRSQADRLVRRQRAGLSHWLDSRISKPGYRGRGRGPRTLRPRARLLCRLFTGRVEPARQGR